MLQAQGALVIETRFQHIEEQSKSRSQCQNFKFDYYFFLNIRLDRISERVKISSKFNQLIIFNG